MAGYRFNPITGNLDLVGSSGGGGGGGPATKYSLAFNATTDWGSLSGGYYTITVTAGTHALGTSPIIEIFELDTGNYLSVMPDEIKVTPGGDVSFRVPGTPDLRFAGKIIIV